MKKSFYFFLLLFISPATPNGWLINLSASMPKGMYRIIDSSPVIGSFVAVCLPSQLTLFARARGYLGPGSCLNQSSLLLKQVVATPETELNCTIKGISRLHHNFVNSKPLTQDAQGRILSPCFTSTSQKGYWLLGTSATSWDSRYFGPITRSHLWYVVQPWWIN